MKTKRCTKCGKSLPVSEFHKHPSTRDGLQNHCKVCIRAYQRQRRQRLKDEGPVIVRDKKRCCSCRKTKPISEFYKEAGTLDGYTPQCKACQLAWHKNFRQTQPELAKQRDHEHYEADPEVYKRARRKRRARKARAEGSHTRAAFVELCEFHDRQCLACGKRFPLVELDEDHIVPLSKGGSDRIENIQPLCGSCNSSKGAQTIDYRVQLDKSFS